MTAFITALTFVVLAEMGDKTQLLGMAFATRYPWPTVMWGVFVATILNHLLAVVVGSYITMFIPLQNVQIAAAASFIIFGLWTIRGDELNGEDKATHRSPFWTVTIAFFIAEMGDKTQLATVALAAQFANEMIPVWLGTTAGMMIANAIGILIGVVLGKKIPERLVKWVAAVIFIFFGVYGLYEYLPREVLTTPVMVGGIAAILLLIFLVAKMGGDKLPREQP
ncbi:TMEM165/GDT1 family protein [Sporomusa sp.]|uniref:TMEM165/GDT1 family protein n=1 Tax=Sporomusa sp. TaxID=2078658 RepID=UPI002C015536|nr:TMEM165/GDT1 family protein [Sporomusa sp.]HWR43880.1 TMEM165/GDT1 family protein [Sporomusa sp.]